MLVIETTAKEDRVIHCRSHAIMENRQVNGNYRITAAHVANRLSERTGIRIFLAGRRDIALTFLNGQLAARRMPYGQMQRHDRIAPLRIRQHMRVVAACGQGLAIPRERIASHSGSIAKGAITRCLLYG